MNEQENLDRKRTCSEIVFAALAEFSKSEATRVVVLFANADGDVVIMRNATQTETIGLCEYGRQMAIRNLFGERA